ncbi:hypothetical protein [Staphylococcus agnetis]|uniref:hypothetical protein n=1 Tax=Staphylococcus agnetis TaxID=985762 RepID=UPI000D040154|nr:hypothetical protein [Staphylococcus agnetis]
MNKKRLATNIKIICFIITLLIMINMASKITKGVISYHYDESFIVTSGLKLIVIFIIGFIVIPIAIDKIFSDHVNHFSRRSRNFINDTNNLNVKNTNTSKYLKKRIYDYFTKHTTINDVEYQQLNGFEVIQWIEDIHVIMNYSSTLLQELQKDISSSPSRLFTPSISSHGMTLTYISKDKIELSTVTLRKTLSYNQINQLHSFHNIYHTFFELMHK